MSPLDDDTADPPVSMPPADHSDGNDPPPPPDDTPPAGPPRQSGCRPRTTLRRPGSLHLPQTLARRLCWRLSLTTATTRAAARTLRFLHLTTRMATRRRRQTLTPRQSGCPRPRTIARRSCWRRRLTTATPITAAVRTHRFPRPINPSRPPPPNTPPPPPPPPPTNTDTPVQPCPVVSNMTHEEKMEEAIRREPIFRRASLMPFPAYQPWLPRLR